jgi:H/ACA ribonucleoprotein complex subunit 2
VIGGDVSPLDVVTHVPVLCEDNDIPYVYVPSRQELGLAAATKRATTLVLIRVPADGSAYKKDYEAIFKTVANLKATVM